MCVRACMRACVRACVCARVYVRACGCTRFVNVTLCVCLGRKPGRASGGQNVKSETKIIFDIFILYEAS